MDKLRSFSKGVTLIFLTIAILAFFIILIKSDSGLTQAFSEHKGVIAIFGYIGVLFTGYNQWVVMIVFQDFKKLQDEIKELLLKAAKHDEEKIFLAKRHSDSIEKSAHIFAGTEEHLAKLENTSSKNQLEIEKIWARISKMRK